MLRFFTLGSRFLFIFFLAKYIEPASVGYYGLFTASIGYSLYFVGMDFYTYVTREILKAPNEEQGKMLKGQIFLSGLMYLFFLPISLFCLYQIDWPPYLYIWFYPILVLEHFNQEISRLLVTFSEQIAASVMQFVRQGGWAIVSVILFYFYAPSRNLNTVLALWVVAGLSALAMGTWKLRQRNIGGWKSNVDWQWVKKGVAISFAYLLSTLALRGINTFDRYLVEALGDIEMVAAYVLLLGVASTLMTFLDAGIFAYAYPALIDYYLKKDEVNAKACVRQVFIQTLFLSAAFGLLSWVFLPYLFDWIGNKIYADSLYLYPWIILAVVVNALSMAPHYALYAQGYDKPIIYSHGVSLLFFTGAAWMLKDYYGIVAIPIGLVLAFMLILIWNSWAYWKTCKIT